MHLTFCIAAGRQDGGMFYRVVRSRNAVRASREKISEVPFKRTLRGMRPVAAQAGVIGPPWREKSLGRGRKQVVTSAHLTEWVSTRICLLGAAHRGVHLSERCGTHEVLASRSVQFIPLMVSVDGCTSSTYRPGQRVPTISDYDAVGDVSTEQTPQRPSPGPSFGKEFRNSHAATTRTLHVSLLDYFLDQGPGPICGAGREVDQDSRRIVRPTTDG